MDETLRGNRKIETVLRPKSIAVIGASREVGSVGHETLRNVIGSVFPVKFILLIPKLMKFWA